MLIVSQESQRKAAPKLLFKVKGGKGGRADTLIRLHILRELYLEIGYVLRCTSSSSSGFIISCIVNKISAYGYIAQAAHYVRVVF